MATHLDTNGGTGEIGTRAIAEPSLPARSIRLQMERILSSPVFARSRRMARFLRFTVEQTLDGHGDQLKEYLLGLEVFDRKSTFDPRLDPIVRVEARRLRSKVQRYYETDGCRDEVEIDYSTGCYAPRFRRRPASAPSDARAQARATNIVVLPFTDLGPNAEYRHFSDGLTEQVIHELTKLEGFRVVAWRQALHLKRRPPDLQSTGERLNAGAVLTGSVRRWEDRLRVVAQLISVEEGRYLWSETYDHPVGHLLALQDEISREVALTLQTRWHVLPTEKREAAGQLNSFPNPVATIGAAVTPEAKPN